MIVTLVPSQAEIVAHLEEVLAADGLLHEDGCRYCRIVLAMPLPEAWKLIATASASAYKAAN